MSQGWRSQAKPQVRCRPERFCRVLPDLDDGYTNHEHRGLLRRRSVYVLLLSLFCAVSQGITLPAGTAIWLEQGRHLTSHNNLRSLWEAVPKFEVKKRIHSI